MQGKIMKGIAGFYYVDTVESGIYECKAKGIFRKQKMKPLVGDDVEIVITHEGDREGNIISILPRTNEMIRPGAVVVDAGTASEQGKLVGDISDEIRARNDLGAITPKVGGVGPLTINVLFENVIIAASKQHKK